nr:DUF4160 domain-containing protein [Pseudomonas luteola]
MSIEDEFSELQRLLAQKDLITEPRKGSGSGFVELLLAKRKNIKYKMYQERGHSTPHIHIDYGRMNHVASYSVETGERMEGNLPKKYDTDVSNWLSTNKEKLVEIWKSLQSGGEPSAIIGELQGDV